MRTWMALLPLLLAAGAALAEGNVETERTADGIVIKGQGGNTAFDVTYGTDDMGNDVLVITGRNDTTINNEASFQVSLRDPLATLVIERSADVNVDLSGLPEAKRFQEVTVTGSGNDETITIRNVQLGEKGKIVVDAGFGTDSVTIEDCDTQSLVVRSHESGSVGVRRCNVDRRLRIETGQGDAEVHVEDSFYQKADIKMNGVGAVQPSRTRIERTAGRKTSFSGTSGDDEVTFENVMLYTLKLKLGDGDDLVSFTGSTVYKLGVDGGRGDDCFDDMQNQNVFMSFKEKNFEPAACNGGGMQLEYFGLGADPVEDPPGNAVAWRSRNPEIGHSDGPFALPGHGAALGLTEKDPLDDVDPAHWADPDICEFIHLHGSFEGHGDPAPGPPTTESACGHGALEWARLAPI